MKSSTSQITWFRVEDAPLNKKVLALIPGGVICPAILKEESWGTPGGGHEIRTRWCLCEHDSSRVVESVAHGGGYPVTLHPIAWAELVTESPFRRFSVSDLEQRSPLAVNKKRTPPG